MIREVKCLSLAKAILQVVFLKTQAKPTTQ